MIHFKLPLNLDSLLHSICAFANDFHNLVGGYLVVGVAEDDETTEQVRGEVGSKQNPRGEQATDHVIHQVAHQVSQKYRLTTFGKQVLASTKGRT